uniref:Uncharacterized protein n=3 Tax=Aegilops tauschii subsp. strangulata TaxID=200361 RepID=A0A453HWH1_AEGTS
DGPAPTTRWSTPRQPPSASPGARWRSRTSTAASTPSASPATEPRASSRRPPPASAPPPPATTRCAVPCARSTRISGPPPPVGRRTRWKRRRIALRPRRWRPRTNSPINLPRLLLR